MTEYEMMKAKNSKREIKTPSIPLFLFDGLVAKYSQSCHKVRGRFRFEYVRPKASAFLQAGFRS